MDHDSILVGAKPWFRDLHAAIGDAMRARFPETTEVVEYGMAAFATPVMDPVPEEDWKGTMPRTHMTVAPTHKKAGITVHVWHPKCPTLLQDNAKWLQGAGFKPMVGCLQWNRKTPFPLDAFERLLDAAQAV